MRKIGKTKQSSLLDITLVLGGARSGKSAYAEGLVTAAGKGIYIATAIASDSEMLARIERHRMLRPNFFTTIEEPLELATVLKLEACRERIILVDCLTLWLANLMSAERNIDTELEALEKTLVVMPVPVILVSNEVGLGIVPENAVARRFRDEAGLLNQQLARLCSRVVLLSAGLPIILKGEG